MESERRQAPFALLPVSLVVLAKIIVHLASITQYGYFRDELYYIASTNHLGPGYVDHPPLSIFFLAIQKMLFGDSLISIRMVPLLCGVAVIVMTAMLARELGGRSFAQSLASLCVLCGPAFLGIHHIYSMNAWDHFFWTLAVLVLVRLLNREDPHLWPVLGVVLGLGLLNKISVLWLGAGIATGLVLTPDRKWLATKGPWLAGLIAFALFAPYMIWNVSNGLPTLEFMRNAAERKMVDTAVLDFLNEQILIMNPAALPVWISGLIFFLFSLQGRRWRILAIIYLTTLIILLAGPRKAGYLVPVYPMLFAGGGVALELWLAKGRNWILRPVLVAAQILLAAPIVPLALPLLPPDEFIQYSKKLGVTPPAEERHQRAELPQHYADMFGWDEMVEKVARAYNTLTPEEKKHCVVFGQNYGEAGAIDVLGKKRGLPRVISGHNSYWFWGPGKDPIDVVIIIGGDGPDNAAVFEKVQIVDQIGCARCMPYERNLDVTIGRKPRIPISELWPQLKEFI